MNASRTTNSVGQEYLFSFRVYVQADGSLVVIMGNQRLTMTPDEVHLFLCGTIEHAKVFTTLHQQNGH